MINAKEKVNGIQFDDIYQAYRQELRQYLSAKVSNEHDAEDILQEVFIKALGHMDKLEKVKSIRAWLYVVTKNKIIDYYKRKKISLVMPHELEDLVEEEVQEDNFNNEIGACLKKASETLPEKYRAVYDLYAYKALKHKEITQALDISLSASKVRLMRAKDQVRDKVKDCCQVETDVYGNIVDYRVTQMGRDFLKEKDMKC